MIDNLPALYERLHLRAAGRVAIVNIVDVACEFEKEHRHVLRDVRGVLATRPDLGALNWFRASTGKAAY